VLGIAVAIIKDNEVVLSKGFGVLKQGSKEEVTADTLFGIASGFSRRGEIDLEN
jgi:CubicO group peptidase (beta-lactamase class C family)